MAHSEEASLPHIYSTTNRAESDPSFQESPSPRHPVRKSAVRMWAGVAIVLCIGCGLFYALYKVATGAQQAVDDSAAAGAIVPSPAELKYSYGIAAGGSLPEVTDAQLDARMKAIAASGAKWVRFDFKWSEIQPDNAKSYKWDVYDKLVRTAQKYNLYILGILDFTPTWARSSACPDTDKCAPANNAQFAQFAKTVSNRYKNRGLHYWEVWNESNSPQFWQPKADAKAYTDLLKRTYTAIHTEDKNAVVMTAGPSPYDTTDESYSPVDFLTAIYANGGKGYFDAVGAHPYTFPITPKNTAEHAWYQMASTTDGMRAVMVKNGDANKKIWITEFGSPTGGPGEVSSIEDPNLEAKPYVVTEDLQAKILSDAVDLYRSYDWVGPFMYYSYQDAGNTPDTNENYFGLVRYDGSKKPAYTTFQTATKNVLTQ